MLYKGKDLTYADVERLNSNKQYRIDSVDLRTGTCMIKGKRFSIRGLLEQVCDPNSPVCITNLSALQHSSEFNTAIPRNYNAIFKNVERLMNQYIVQRGEGITYKLKVVEAEATKCLMKLSAGCEKGDGTRWFEYNFESNIELTLFNNNSMISVHGDWRKYYESDNCDYRQGQGTMAAQQFPVTPDGLCGAAQVACTVLSAPMYSQADVNKARRKLKREMFCEKIKNRDW